MTTDEAAAQFVALTDLRAQRDRARDWAVRLEQQNAAALALHHPECVLVPDGPESADYLDVCAECQRITDTSTPKGFGRLLASWPCPTAEALGADDLDRDVSEQRGGEAPF